jgi:hypothetical protein
MSGKSISTTIPERLLGWFRVPCTTSSLMDCYSSWNLQCGIQRVLTQDYGEACAMCLLNRWGSRLLAVQLYAKADP